MPSSEKAARIFPERRFEEHNALLTEQTAELSSTLILPMLLILTFIAVCAALAAAKSFFLPVTAALIVGSTLTRSAKFLEQRRIPRGLATTIVFAAAGGLVVLIAGLVTAPLMDWADGGPEFAALSKSKAAMFQQPLSWLHSIQTIFGDGFNSDGIRPDIIDLNSIASIGGAFMEMTCLPQGRSDGSKQHDNQAH